ncbi:MAG: rhamnulokinase family protein [Spirochaetota bacterium]
MADEVFLIVDCGASNGRILSANFNGRTFTICETHRFDNRPVFARGTLYWDVLHLFSEIKIGLQKAVRENKRNIGSIGIDTWGVDFGFIDRQGRLLANPVHYRDARRHEVRDEFFKLISEQELFQASGIFQLTIMSAYLLFAMKLDNTTEYENAHRLLFMPDLFNYLLTGETYNEASVADTSMLYNVFSKSWDRTLIDKLGLNPSIFGDIVMPGTPVGKLAEEVCREIEVPPIPVIAPAGHDTASAVIGIPVTPTKKPWAFISLGTWAVLGMETPRPVIDLRLLKKGYGNEVYARGDTFLARNITGLWIIQQCRERWMCQQGREIAWQEIVDAAASSETHKAFIDVDDPLFAQVQTDMPGVIQKACTTRSQPAIEGIGPISRCVFESLTLKFRACTEQLKEYSGFTIEGLHIVGGGTKNRLLCQWTSDALGLPVTAGPTETTAIGNLLMQLQGTGKISSLSEGRGIVLQSAPCQQYEPSGKDRWDEAYARFLKIIG